jgi:DNA replication and repair protein RecF
MGAGRVSLSELTVSSFRNLADQSFAPDPTLNLICGDNGQGKTALLEAIYVVATSRSFRAPRLREVIRHGHASFNVRATFIERRGDLPALDRTQNATFQRGALHLRVDGNEPDNIVSYARRSPVVVFHPDELQLSSGPAALRRRLLDRLSFYLTAGALRASTRYARALRARQELLRRPASPLAELEAFERVAAQEGAAVTRFRGEAVERFAPALLAAFGKIASPELTLAVRYAAGGAADEEAAAAELRERRHRDAHVKVASFGPHRDELALELDGYPARQVASQGQHRALALSMKAAESSTIAESTGLWPIQLLDDISSELDPSRTEALFRFLEATHGQLFITGTREGLLRAALSGSNPKTFQVVKGDVRAV